MEIRAEPYYIAPGDYHLRVRRSGTRLFAALDQSPQENSCRPAVDVLFRSLAETFGKETALGGAHRHGLRRTARHQGD